MSGICGCTEETSCYGCLRNYSNQYYHDDISRGMALKYIDWLLNEAVANKPPVSAPEAPAVTAEESIGLKKSFYEAPDTSTLPDTESQLKSMLLAANDESVIAGISKLLDYVGSKNYEHPLIDEPIWLDDTVWPDIIWGKAHVAVFSPAKIKQYKLLKKYDWYCYILDENIDAALLFSHIKELVELVLKYYGQLSEKYRKMIPLKMVYIPVTLDTELKLNDYPL